VNLGQATGDQPGWRPGDGGGRGCPSGWTNNALPDPVGGPLGGSGS
jgi:hypothetical protein